MNKQIRENRYEFGLKGQDFVEARLKDKGYVLHKKNFRQIGLEIDLIVYKLCLEKKILTIRIIEVKTRRLNGYSVDLEQMNIPHKWEKVRRIMFNVPCEIKNMINVLDCTHVITFDLAIVDVKFVTSKEESFHLHRYIQNVNLLL